GDAVRVEEDEDLCVDRPRAEVAGPCCAEAPVLLTQIVLGVRWVPPLYQSGDILFRPVVSDDHDQLLMVLGLQCGEGPFQDRQAVVDRYDDRGPGHRARSSKGMIR